MNRDTSDIYDNRADSTIQLTPNAAAAHRNLTAVLLAPLLFRFLQALHQNRPLRADHRCTIARTLHDEWQANGV